MIARSDSGYHGPELDSLGRSSTFSANAPPVPSIPATLRRQTDAEPPVGLPFAAYRLTQAPPASFDSMNGDEDEVMELDDDDAQEPGPDATMMSLGSPVGPAPSPSPMHGGAPGAQSADRRRMGFTPPPRTTSARTAAEAVAAATSAALVPTASSPPLGLEAEPGEFGMPPSGHPFWTNPRIFDAVTAASATRPMLGDMPSVVWEINPTDGTRRLMAACPVKLVEVLTTTLDYKFLTDFFLVYRCFMSPVQLGMLLILRFRWAMMKPDSEDHALVRFRTFIVLRHWISEYYVQDFAASRALRYLMIVSFINVIAEDPQVRANARDYRLVKTLKRLLRTEDQAYKHYKTMYTESGGDPRVPDALASWVYQVSVEKHFEPVYFPILSYVNAQSGGLARAGSAMASNPRDSGVDPTGSAASSLRDRDSAISAGGRPVSNATTALASSERKRHSRNGSESFVSGFFDAVSDRRLSGGGSSAASSPMVAAVASPGVSPSVVGAPASTMVANVPSALVALMSTSKSFLLAYKLDVIAEQFLLIEEMMLLSIPWPALISHSTMSGHSSAPGSPVQAMIDRFNATCQWVATEVCSQRSMDDRVKVIEKLIRLAVRSQILGNYSTVNAVTLGLQNPLVERLKKTWSKVSNVEKKQLRELITLTAPLKNWSALRAAQAGELERGSGIPFTGIVLSDLVFNREMSSELGKCRIDVVGQGQVALPVLNYHKFRVMAQAVDQFKAFQRTKRPPQGFGPELVPAYANCLLLRTVPNDELKRLSLECERK
ncbi:ras guanine nucleotide exchange factor domain-containing protein [Blastocladiella britannica]|nr:ras guanine nucleotide exchange factor domain-containing protein [Blastocladiella britannica]